MHRLIDMSELAVCADSNPQLSWRSVQEPAGAGAVQRRHPQVRRQRQRPGRLAHDGDRRLLPRVRGLQPQQDNHVHLLM
jgi:hypothetical protein